MTKRSPKGKTKIWFESDLNKLMEKAGVHAHEEKIAVCKVLAELNIAAMPAFAPDMN